MIRAFVSTFKRILHGRIFAYNRVFDPQSVHTRTVLLDLAKFCRAHQTCFHPDPRLHAMLEGRREVWLKIQEYLQLTDQEIYDLHKIKEIDPKELENAGLERERASQQGASY